MREIHNAGYRGCWGMEFLPAGDPLEELERAAYRFNAAL